MKTSLIIPNWNGRKLLEKNLPFVLAAKPDEIIIVDNNSEDDSVSFLEREYPQVKVIKYQKNYGFAIGCNKGVEASTGEIAVLLNSDVVPEKDFIKNAAPNFNDKTIFAVSFNELQWSWARYLWKNGCIEIEPGPKSEKTHLSAWANGGSGAFRKSIWKKLGGFETIYNPFYWEDVDLSYRAWKRGYRVLWEPRAIVHHEHEGTIGKYFSKNYTQFVSERNRLFFVWKNITSSKMMHEHKVWLGKKLMTSLSFWRPFLAASVSLSKILSKRLIEQRDQKLSDEEILSNF